MRVRLIDKSGEEEKRRKVPVVQFVVLLLSLFCTVPLHSQFDCTTLH